MFNPSLPYSYEGDAMRIRYIGHAAFQIVGSKNVIIDPFLHGNPVAAELEGKPDLILVTYDIR